MKNTTVVITTYNGIQWIQKCIESVLKSPVITAIVIIDNNSSDGTVSYIEKNFPKVTLLKQTENLGFGAANNIGMAYALKNNVDYVFLLNQDAYLQSNCIERLIEVYEGNKDYGILSPIHLNGAGTGLDKNFSNYVKRNDTLFYDALKHNFTESLYNVPFVNAAAWFLPKATLENVGGFDPIFYHYSEDDNYCQRVLFHSYKIGIVPNCYINHDRELRLPKKPINNNDKIILRERHLKLKWADINCEVKSEIELSKRKLQTFIPKLFIRFKFNKAKYCLKELALINKIVPEIYRSRKTNKTKGQHYI